MSVTPDQSLMGLGLTRIHPAGADDNSLKRYMTTHVGIWWGGGPTESTGLGFRRAAYVIFPEECRVVIFAETTETASDLINILSAKESEAVCVEPL